MATVTVATAIVVVILYVVLVVIDAASNLLWAFPQKSKTNEEMLSLFDEAMTQFHVKPRAICGDEYFYEEKILSTIDSRISDLFHLNLILLGPIGLRLV